MSYHVVSLFPKPGDSGTVSSMWCVYSALLSWLLYPSGQLSGEALFGCRGQCLVPALNVAHFNQMCSVCLWSETYHHCQQNYKTPESGHVWASVWAGLLGEGACHAGTEANMTVRDSSTGAQTQGVLGISKLGSECEHSVVSCRWPCTYAEGWGKKMNMASSFVPRVVSPWTLPLWDIFWKEWITSPLCALGALQISVSILYVCRLFAGLLSKSSTVPSRL